MPTVWGADWGLLTSRVRDAIPEAWDLPPLVPGQQLLVMSSPDRRTEYRLWGGGPDWPPPSGVKLYGVEHPPHEASVAMHERAKAEAGFALIFTIPVRERGGVGIPTGLRKLDAGNAQAAFEALVRLAQRWEAEHRPTVPWKSRAEALIERRDREQAAFNAAVRRVQEEQAAWPSSSR